VDCQVDHICGRHPADLERALAELPETLDETYERTLRGIQEADWALAHRIYQFVAVASRPLHITELAELFAFDFDVRSIPKFHKDWRIEDPADAVLSACSSLLFVDGGNHLGNAVQFSHFSVKEFLTSTRLAESTDAISRRYHISMIPAHTLVAQACLGILLHLDKDAITSDSLEDFPLAEYAAGHWVDHARFEDVSRNVEGEMKQLFDPSKSHLAVCVWICDPAVPTSRQEKRGERALPLPQSSLHYAASWGLHSIVEWLIIELSQNVRSRRSTDNASPLHLASENGHVKAACKLIECGADPTAQDNGGQTALHLASQRGHMDVALVLIERGADLTAQNNDGETPLNRALEFHEVRAACMLIERGADVTIQDNYGWAPLHLASFSGEVDITRMLIERGADVTAQNNGGETPLHLVLSTYWVQRLPQRYVDVVHMLLERGADVNAKNMDGCTLYLASQGGPGLANSEVMRVLVDYGADSGAHNNIS
jgi:ankyrin repeat protein